MDSDRKYRQHGYYDSSSTPSNGNGSNGASRPKPTGPRPPLDVTGPRLPRLVQAVTASRCYSCSTTLPPRHCFSTGLARNAGLSCTVANSVPISNRRRAFNVRSRYRFVFPSRINRTIAHCSPLALPWRAKLLRRRFRADRGRPESIRRRREMPAMRAMRSTGSSRSSATLRRYARVQQRSSVCPHFSTARATPPLPASVAQQAQCPHVGQIALPSAFRNRHNMIGVPKRLPAALTHLPSLQELSPRREIQFPHVPSKRDRVGTALRANAAVAREYLVSQISRIGSQLPFMDALFRTEAPSPFRHLGSAPSAERASGWPSLNGRGPNPPARFRSRYQCHRGRGTPSVSVESTT